MTPLATAGELALALPGAEERDHWGRPSYRIKGRIFATLHPADRRMVVKLPIDERLALTDLDPQTASAVPGAWGRQGWTIVELARADRRQVARLLRIAYDLVLTPKKKARGAGRAPSSER
jgi:predicted DNA-binding protein (MmcQ/YjbR family)